MPEQYDVFISYRRSDGSKAARRLRRLIQDYRPPRALRSNGAQLLKVYIDTVYERATNDFFVQTTLPALLASPHLAVVLTPDAVDRGPDKTDWIRREIAEFEKGPNAGNIIAIRAVGAFDGPLPVELVQRYPNIEIIDLRGAGPFSFLVPLRAARLAEETAKLVAPLLGIGPEQMPVLRREEERRQQTRLGITVGSSVALLVSVAGLSVLAFQSRNRAVDALSKSLFSADRLIEAAETSMQPSERRSQLLMTACDLLDSLRTQAEQEPGTGALVDCAIERADRRDSLGERKEADTLIDNALKLAQAKFDATKSADDGMALVQIARTELDRDLKRDPAIAAGAPLSDFIERAQSVIVASTEEAAPAKNAADALQAAAVFFGEAKLIDASLAALEAASAFRKVSAARRPSAAETIELAAILSLKAHYKFSRKQTKDAAIALKSANDLLAEINPKTLDETVGARLRVVRGIVDEVAAKGKAAMTP